ncbi:hypothetical protein HMPREF0080_01110 [Anaeroglobus geminatus F0357]|uniref:Uncharacterized protein n=1 Tax=Anaeroglobus geminatus F0357 TaxID=861450 RepID=G9YHH9_9FIRM|nr:hypothetical protein HMPREF0080_01110 [Anaeroglobus geminatus F0357]
MKDLIIEYMNRIVRDLSFRHQDEELADLAGQYKPRKGICWLRSKTGRHTVALPSDAVRTGAVR